MAEEKLALQTRHFLGLRCRHERVLGDCSKDRNADWSAWINVPCNKGTESQSSQAAPFSPRSLQGNSLRLLEMHRHGKLLPRAGLPLLYALNLGIVRVGIGHRTMKTVNLHAPPPLSDWSKINNWTSQHQLHTDSNRMALINAFFGLKLFMAPPWIMLMLVASLLFQRQQMDRNSSALSILPVNTVYGIWSILSIKKNLGKACICGCTSVRCTFPVIPWVWWTHHTTRASYW